ncbi:MAG: ABC transporter substrate-binding protein, partial [Emcibacteraceae bacterium]|nr:ABC transporter substrate-binding protein [Emcibacteraceae bacterium]
YVHDELKTRFNIELVRVPINDAQDVVQKLIRDKRFAREEGSVDLLWVNGENFKVMKDNDLTIAPFLSDLENSKYVNLNNPTIANDFGTKHQGREMPWGSAEMVFIYDQAKIKSPPKTLNDLKEWIKANPGKFTYSAPPDFTGSAFIRQTLLNIVGKEKYNDLVINASNENLKAELPKLWSFLKEISPYLYREGDFYPESVSKLHQLFSDGTVWMTMDYYPTTGERMKNQGIFPRTTKTFVLDDGALANTHYITIPYNAPNQTAAKTVANFLLGIDAQSSKLNPENWGDFSVLDLSKLSDEDKATMKSVNLGDATLSLEILDNAKAQELPAEYIPMIEAEWKKNIIQN